MRHHINPMTLPRESVPEAADMLALAFLRLRMRRRGKEIPRLPENCLDDVRDSARVGTGEARTSEKGARP